jgi:hypothetical protein
VFKHTARTRLLGRALAAIPSLAMASVFIIAAVVPDTVGAGFIAYLLVLLLVEFFVIHSSWNIGLVADSNLSRPVQIAAIAALSSAYGLVVYGISLTYGVTWPLWAFLTLTIARLFGIYLAPEPSSRRHHMNRGWAVSTVLYIVLATVFLVLTIDREYTTGLSGSAGSARGAGAGAAALLGRAPFPYDFALALVFGSLYFVLTGLSSLFNHRWYPEDWSSMGLPSRREKDDNG